MSSQGRCQEPIQRLRAAPKLDERQQWESVAQSLRDITAHLEAWGGTMRKIKPPAWETVEDVEMAIDDLYPAFETLTKWLKVQGRRKSHWPILLDGICAVMETEMSDILPPLSVYIQQMPNRRTETKALVKNRKEVADLLRKLAEKIEDAVNKAEAQLS